MKEMKRNKEWWKDLAERAVSEYQTYLFDQITKDIEEGNIRVETSINEDDYVAGLIDDIIIKELGLTAEELNKLNHRAVCYKCLNELKKKGKK
jgi:hypothetical protein